MKECSKSIARRLAESNFASRYFVGNGLDIGGNPDPLSLYRELFYRIEHVTTWDKEQGDAQYLHGVADGSFDFVHSSHCLEHLHDPKEGLQNWFRVLKHGGYLIVTVPDEDLYEQGVFPSTFNHDHKWTFTIHKERSWSNRSVNVLTLVSCLGQYAEVVKIALLNNTYRYQLPRYDQTLTTVGECGIEFVIRKRLPDEVNFGGNPPRAHHETDREIRIHLNQSRDDLATLKRTNVENPPFENDGDL